MLNKKGQPNLSYKDLKNRFSSEPSPTLSEVRKAVLEIRSRKFPDLKEYGTAGSFFKNPIISKEKLGKLLKKFPEMPHYSAGEDAFKISTAWTVALLISISCEDPIGIKTLFLIFLSNLSEYSNIPREFKICGIL